ncbi:hypothetical protein BP6252_01951 [Coleophoma cylindrospora]|uniref:Rhodopsin domain-containing protein n=1 Tax=Coleophoma cylindrospora TaxID=1849047 RepID=A0A3D8SDW0_9HELO|nr:hypothetical protein BP6252_01951 [Coleophoma cylindrospora]
MPLDLTENKGPQLHAVAIAFVSLAWIGVLLRAYTRAVIVKQITWDDKFVAASLVFYTLYCSFVLVGVKHGTGQHDADLTVDNMLTALRFWYYCEWAYVITMCFIKVAIAILYLRVFFEKWQRRVVWITLVGVILTGFSYLLAVVLQCIPVPFIWHRYHEDQMHKGACLPVSIVLAGTYIHSAVSAISDFTLAGLPIILLWNLRFPVWKKFWIGVMMSLGAIAVVATLIRLHYVESLAVKEDFLFDTFGVAVWSTVEPGIALFAVCLSVLRPLLVRIMTSKSGKCIRTIASLGVDLSPDEENPYGTLAGGLKGDRMEVPLPTPPVHQRDADLEAATFKLFANSTHQSRAAPQVLKSTPTQSTATLELDHEMTNPVMFPMRIKFEGLNTPELVLNRWSHMSKKTTIR